MTSEQHEDILDFAETVRSVGTLVACRTHRWGAAKKDPKAGQQIATANNTRMDATTVTKHLMVGADSEYKALTDELNAARRYHDSVTVAWDKNGSGARLLANRRTFEYAKEMGGFRDRVKIKRAAFAAVYSQRRDEAIAELGPLANPDDYPTPDDIEKRFGIETEFFPVPSGKDFGYLDDTLASAIADNLNARVSKWVGTAMQDGWTRMEKTIAKMHETLADEEQTKFKTTLVSNIKNMVGLVKDFNITNDPKYTTMVEEVEEKLCSLTVPQLKNSVAKRREVAAHAEDILAKLAEFGLAA